MRPLLIEGGIYFLLFFTPLAFGGVELWAQGVVQIVSGFVLAAWLWGRLRGEDAGSRFYALWPRLLLGAPFAGFVVLVLLQLTPMPHGILARISPAADRVYQSALPGYAEGRPLDARELPGWLLERHAGEVPGAADDGLQSLDPAIQTAGGGPAAPAWRTLSLSPPETRVRLALLLSCASLFLVTADWFRTKERLTRLMTAAVLSAGVISLFGIVQRLTWNGKLYWLREGQYKNPFGPFVNRNSYAAFAGTILPIALCLAFYALRQWKKGRRDALPLLLLWSLTASAMGVGIALSLSRGGLISAGLSIAIVAGMLLYYGRDRGEVALLAGVVAATILLLVSIGPEMVIERVGTLSEGQSIPSFAQRMKAWDRTDLMIADYPLVGAGFGAFRFSFMRYAPPGEGWWTTAHNEYLELLCDTGLVGAALAAVGLIAWLVLVARPALLKGRSERYSWAGLAAGIAGLLVHSAVSSNLQVPANGVLISLLAGALLALTARHAAASSPSGPGQ